MNGLQTGFLTLKDELPWFINNWGEKEYTFQIDWKPYEEQPPMTPEERVELSEIGLANREFAQAAAKHDGMFQTKSGERFPMQDLPKQDWNFERPRPPPYDWAKFTR